MLVVAIPVRRSRSHREGGIIENSQSNLAFMPSSRRKIPLILFARQSQKLSIWFVSLCICALVMQGCQSALQREAMEREARLNAVLSNFQLTRRMFEIEEQIIERVDASPIEVGPLSSALLDLDENSLVAHFGLSAFYEAVEETQSKAHHAAIAEQIAGGVEKFGASFIIGSPAQAEAYLRVLGYTCIGWHYPPKAPLTYQIVAVDEDGVNHRLDFLIAQPELLAPEGIEVNFNRFEDLLVLMQERSRIGDTAARSLIRELYLAHSEKGVPDWFEGLPAGRANVNIDLLQGAVQQNIAATSEGETRLQAVREAERYYQRAARVGSTQAMWLLGRLYRSPVLGPGNEHKAVQLYRDAAKAKDLGAIRELAGFLQRGDSLFEQNLDEARTLLRNAYLWGDTRDLRRYIEFLRRREGAVEFDHEALESLRELAEESHAWSLITLGNLYADGVGVETNYRRARSLMREAAREAPEHPDLINEVAWVLSTSNRPQLRDDRFALRIMDHMMSANEQARQNPMFLDTWAATYAANGDFEQAIRLQHQALEAADVTRLEEYLVGEMKEHLERFNQGEELSKENFDADDPDVEEAP